MATSSVDLPVKTWVEVSTVSTNFQLQGGASAYAVEAAVIPTDTAIKKEISPGEIYTFQKLDGNLYMYAPYSTAKVALDPLS